ncbi:hypothetical protein EDD90_2718 [Streptomyces sp. Ag109_O5-1]|uniref:hypothetical protein n=1 Tax=Streptomyces sp. Ag109_O5-1 TaxID=1938851 RepID=UPI000F507B2D|nr:hypothetical protein [Streptomyces sp. Ag109_O5-1]RPE39701.1 hypothetical protein EDD90_2718 [Streptomyces sp. Ag109_O5-1]
MPSKKTIEDAIGALRDGTGPRPDLADAVQELADQRYKEWSGTGTTVPFKADIDLLARVGEGRLEKVVADGCARFLVGELEPVRTVRGAAGAKRPTSVRVDNDLLARVTARCDELSERLGWKVRPVNVFVAAFEAAPPATE